jgi:hypothetical protein
LGLVFSDYDHLLNALQIWTNAGKLPTRDRDLLAALKQTSSITDFIQRLNTIRARLDITDDEAQGRFRRGLKKEIRVKIDSTSLTWTDLATMQREALKQEGVTNYQSTGAPVTFGDGMDVDATEIYAAEIVKKPFKKLTDGERNFLTKNNGCFRCRKINVDHRANTCPSFQLAAQRNVETLEVAVASIASDVGVFSEDFDRYDITDLAPPLRPTTGHGIKSDLNKNLLNNLNIPQFVSKDREPGDWMLNKEISAELFAQWGQPKVDLFASKRNKQAEFFYRNPMDKSKPTSGCLGNDAFAAKWHSEELLYANPPWNLTERVIEKLKKER